MSYQNPYRKIMNTKSTPKKLAARPKVHFEEKQDEHVFDESGEFNPQPYDTNSSREASKSELNRRMFNTQGELNAYDKTDALQQIQHLLNSVTKKNANKLSMYNPESNISKDEQRRILCAALQDDSGVGLRVIGQQLALPIKAILDYEGFARKIYRVRQLGQAELFRIPKDIRSVAYIIGQDGQTPEARIKTKWITPEEYKVSSMPTIDIQDIYQMNFDVLERAQDTARQEIELQEDRAGINLLDSASSSVNSVTTFASLGVGAFEDVRFQVERHRLMVEKFLISRAELSDIVKTMSAAVDPVTTRELLMAGYIGNFLNAQIITAAGTGVEEVIPAGTFYAVTGEDYLGELGERKPLDSEPYNKYAVQEFVKGWAFVEIIGFGLPNAKAVAKGQK